MSIEALYGKYRIAKADGSLVDPQLEEDTHGKP